VVNPVIWKEFVACVKKQIMAEKSQRKRSYGRQSANGRIIL
jgi:hypothetical protein